MRNRLLLIGVFWALLLPNAILADATRKPAASSQASLKITFVIPKRVEAAAYVASTSSDSSGCLITRDAREVSVNAVVRDDSGWRLKPVKRRAASTDSALQSCDDDLATGFEIESEWDAGDGVVTLVVSPI